MASATVHKLPESEPADSNECILQAHALLHVLLRNYGGEVAANDRPQDQDVFRALGITTRLLETCIEQLEMPGMADSQVHLEDAVAILKITMAGSFIRADESYSGRITQAHCDDIVTNAIWAASSLVGKARNASADLL